ncbi:hypothetical protein CI238_05935 [Colletotrichum incanum]|uniref:HTH psq-type domain-containing protein n=1 Tax=Colletotrichum incanum TaxID=1573173 RepID=A0A167C0G8_COLIC|nr:hypothetical protein CI238_05935 [Colletotrichum incanum]
MPRYTPEHLQGAIDSVMDGVSIKKSAKQWGVPYSTLCGRLTGSISNTAAKEDFQRISLRGFVTKILVAAGDKRPLGKKWMEGFLKRNPAVKTLKSKKIDYKRVKSVTIEAI